MWSWRRVVLLKRGLCAWKSSPPQPSPRLGKGLGLGLRDRFRVSVRVRVRVRAAILETGLWAEVRVMVRG